MSDLYDAKRTDLRRERIKNWERAARKGRKAALSSGSLSLAALSDELDRLVHEYRTLSNQRHGVLLKMQHAAMLHEKQEVKTAEEAAALIESGQNPANLPPKQKPITHHEAAEVVRSQAERVIMRLHAEIATLKNA